MASVTWTLIAIVSPILNVYISNLTYQYVREKWALGKIYIYIYICVCPLGRPENPLPRCMLLTVELNDI